MMAAGKFWVTYDIVTPESAECGDFAESGFVLPGEWRAAAGGPDNVNMSLRSAMDLCNPDYESGGWFSESDGRQNFRTGAVETRSIHPPAGISAASFARVARVLGVKC